MTLHFDQMDTSTIHHRCIMALTTLNYLISEHDRRNGIIRAAREQPAGTESCVIDLRIRREPQGVELLVITGQRSNVFGTIRFDATKESEFVDQLISSIDSSNVRCCEFRISEIEYAFASML